MEVDSSTVVEVQITMRLSREDHDRVLATKQPFDKVAAYLIEQYSKGGVLLRPSQVHHLEKLAGHPVQTAEAVMHAFEQATSRGSAAGYLRVTYDVDPAFAEPLEQLARSQGRSVEAIINEGMYCLLTNQWIAGLPIEGGTLLFTQKTREELEKLIGVEPLTTTAILKWAKELKKLEPKQPRLSPAKREVLARLDAATEAVN